MSAMSGLDIALVSIAGSRFSELSLAGERGSLSGRTRVDASPPSPLLAFPVLVGHQGKATRCACVVPPRWRGQEQAARLRTSQSPVSMSSSVQPSARARVRPATRVCLPQLSLFLAWLLKCWIGGDRPDDILSEAKIRKEAGFKAVKVSSSPPSAARPRVRLDADGSCPPHADDATHRCLTDERD